MYFGHDGKFLGGLKFPTGMKIQIKFRNTSDDCQSKFKSDVEKGLRHFHVYDNLSIND